MTTSKVQAFPAFAPRGPFDARVPLSLPPQMVWQSTRIPRKESVVVCSTHTEEIQGKKQEAVANLRRLGENIFSKLHELKKNYRDVDNGKLQKKTAKANTTTISYNDSTFVFLHCSGIIHLQYLYILVNRKPFCGLPEVNDFLFDPHLM